MATFAAAKGGEGLSSLTFALQALLMRHEAYIADSERERKAMAAHIEHLEEEKQTLERKNASIIEENHDLLDQLEALNNVVVDSETHITSLQATLQSTQQELQRLSQLAARTERLEQQLQDYEREQAAWQSAVEVKDESEKSATKRWQQAERALADLNDQMERIEAEAKEERERHVEVVGRMERRRAVERELTTAAGRLKGAAAVKTTNNDGGGTSVVSHFVKDILQDNANLQLGIVELREMLQNSNDEVDTLRRQLEEHQPADEPAQELPSQTTIKRQDLRQELQRASSSELHVHHHYHAPTTASKTPTLRRAKKKRYGVLTPGHFTPPSGYSTPRSSISCGTPSLAATILQQTAVSIPQPTRKRFSIQSSGTYNSYLSTSGPTSPQSTTNRTSSMFDHVFSDGGHESSRPTTPGSEDLGSPLMAPIDAKRTSFGSSRSRSVPMVHRHGISPHTSRPSMDSILSTSLDQVTLTSDFSNHDAIPEEIEGEWEADTSNIAQESSSIASPLSEDLLEPLHTKDFYKPMLRRAASHESLMSVSGMDIHTLRSRPSQLLVGSGGRSFSTRAEVSNAQATRTTATISRPSDTSHSLLSGMAAEQRLSSKTSSSGLGKRVGGWVFGRWGATPAPASFPSPRKPADVKTASKPPSRSSTSDKAAPAFDPEATPKKTKIRPPGINQSGPIMGFGPEVRFQHPPVMKTLDTAALRKALDD
ncbi:hypothetical protein LTR62_007131 [Meristemomyces frigidus]|uniref:Uncharacterized protein n=1 Tax=Meristemomyces frigidus TaxID=1508187 RepID=A0AAN7TB95_9PEZI|nr:hypothetical protein LTR62_007131 [Meristemomyces frigidus]